MHTPVVLVVDKLWSLLPPWYLVCRLVIVAGALSVVVAGALPVVVAGALSVIVARVPTVTLAFSILDIYVLSSIIQESCFICLLTILFCMCA